MSEIYSNHENVTDVNVSMDRLSEDLLHYQNEIAINTKEQKEHVKSTCITLKNAFNQLVDDKLNALIDQIDESEMSSLEKLQVCKLEIEEHLKKVNQVIEKHQNGNTEEQKALEELGNLKLCSSKLISTSHFGGVSVHFMNESQVLGQLKSTLASLCQVSCQPFLVITEVSPKMSSVTVRWKVPGELAASNVSSYVLQMKEVGGLSSSSDYSEVYRGTQNAFVARRLKPNQEYSFRVSTLTAAQFPVLWSVPKSTSTLDPTLKWKSDAPCVLSNNGATLTTISLSSSLYTSCTKSFECGKVMTIFVESIPLDVDIDEEDGFGLSTLDANDISPMNKGALFLTSSGVVYVGLQKMTTRLPAIRKGSIVTFDSQVLPSNKVRITIEVEEKVVTFDWASQFDSPNSPFSRGERRMNFFARLASPGWSVTVE